MNVRSEELSSDGDDLSNDLRIAISEVFLLMHSSWVGMNHQAVVLPAATPAQIRSFTLENDVQRLLPHRFRPAIVWLFLLSIHKREHPAH